jgi:HD superfamily phosphodiesterase
MTEKESLNIEFQDEAQIENLLNIQKEAQAYMNQFNSENELIKQNFDLKRTHIQHVAAYAEQIAEATLPTPVLCHLAVTAAWLHDIGRFEQLLSQQTYTDTTELDHGVFGVQVLESNNWLQNLPESFRHVINFSVENHNKFSITATTDSVATEVCKIIRDADKLDIIEQTIQEFGTKNRKRNNLFSLGLKDSPAISPEVSKRLEQKKLIAKSELQTVTDFKLMIMQFALDLNFKKSFIILNNKQLMKFLFEVLPKSDVVFEAYRHIKIQIENNIR